MNTANHLKALADQHHYGTLEMDKLIAITEKIIQTATNQAQKGQYEMTISCNNIEEFHYLIPKNRTNIRVVEKELHNYGYETKVYSQSDQYGYLLHVRWGQPPTDVRIPHPAIYGSNRPF